MQATEATAAAAEVGGWRIAARSGAALAAALGVGRFVYTPLLPLMHAQAGMSAGTGALVATSNYVGYLLGALAAVLAPQLGRSRAAFRVSGTLLVATLAAMPATHTGWMWVGLRGIAGAASAVMFLIGVNTVLAALPAHRRHLSGWAYGGVGAGIAASGLLVLTVRSVGDWQAGWFAAAALTGVLVAAGWSVGATLDVPDAPDTAAAGGSGLGRRSPVHWGSLAVSYTLEGAGYIIAGTFLVAAVGGSGPGWLPEAVWIVVGLAALPSCALWAWASRHVSRPSLLTGALGLQALGVALPAVAGGPGPDLVAAALFGATFVGITTLALAAGAHLRLPRAAATLSLGYAAGQILGPLVVRPLLAGGYRDALLVGAALVAAAALGAALLRLGFPHGGEAHRGHRHPRTPATALATTPTGRRTGAPSSGAAWHRPLVI